ncbi:MAG: PAS domain-containing protein [Candidatus Limnocylindrales bacterium]
MTAAGPASIEPGFGSARVAVARARPVGSHRLLRESGGIVLLLAGVDVIFGITVLAGWGLGLPLLKSWGSGLVETKINAAICFAGLGLALGLQLGPASRARSWLGRALAVVVIAIAGATLFEHLTGIGLGIDQALAPDTVSAVSPHPGRFAVQTAVAFIGASLAILALGRKVRGLYLSEALAIVCGSIGGISVLGYMYGAGALESTGSAAQVSLPSSIVLTTTGVALIAANVHHSLLRLMDDSGVPGQVIRRILPAALLVIPAGAWLRLVGERAGLYDEAVGLSIMVAFEALILVAVGAWTTIRVRQLEAAHLEALSDLMRLGAAAATPLIGTAPVGLAVLDCELRFLYVNPALAEMGRISTVASLGQRLDLMVPAIGHEAVAALTGVLDSGVAIRDFEVTGQPGSGGPAQTWLVGAEALRDSDGNTTGLTVSVVDITERKHREEALAAVAELRGQAQAIGESIPFGIWLAGPDGRMRYLSESYLKMSGQSMEVAAGFGWQRALAPEVAEQAGRDWADAVAARKPWNYELLVEGSDGRRRAVLSRGFPVRDEAGRVISWAGINLDITDRKEAEEFREAFLGILSHELGTPITSIYAASTLMMRPGLDAAQQAELIGDIGDEAERLRRLVEDLVVLARAERGTIQVHTEPVLLQHLLRKVCDQEQRRWPECRISLSLAKPLPVVRAEDAFVEQIVRNLLENAAKYGPRGGQVDVVVDAPDGSVRVRVLDRGPGIDPAEAERLFEVFYRSQRTSRVAGSGIGLFVAHRLVESIGGTIWARPRDDGPGAEFGFTLQPFTEDLA